MIYFVNLVLFEVALRIGNTGICKSCSQWCHMDKIEKKSEKIYRPWQSWTDLKSIFSPQHAERKCLFCPNESLYQGLPSFKYWWCIKSAMHASIIKKCIKNPTTYSTTTGSNIILQALFFSASLLVVFRLPIPCFNKCHQLKKNVPWVCEYQCQISVTYGDICGSLDQVLSVKKNKSCIILAVYSCRAVTCHVKERRG